MLLISCSQVSVETDLCASPSTSSNTTALGLRTVGGAKRCRARREESCRRCTHHDVHLPRQPLHQTRDAGPQVSAVRPERQEDARLVRWAERRQGTGHVLAVLRRLPSPVQPGLRWPGDGCVCDLRELPATMQGSAGDRRREAALFILHRRRARKFYDLRVTHLSLSASTWCRTCRCRRRRSARRITLVSWVSTCLRWSFIVAAVMANLSKTYISTCGRRTRTARTATLWLLPWMIACVIIFRGCVMLACCVCSVIRVSARTRTWTCWPCC